MTVRKMIEWLGTQDPDSVVWVLGVSDRPDYIRPYTAYHVVFDPTLHADRIPSGVGSDELFIGQEP